MRKIPTVFQRDPDNMATVLPEWHPDCLWVRDGEGYATRKYDGTCVLIRRDGLAVHAFTRREVRTAVGHSKRPKPPPPGFVEVEHDPVTGKTVGWEPAEQSSFARFIEEALAETSGLGGPLPGTYELVGPRINGNPERLASHVLLSHEAAERTEAPRDVIGLRQFVCALAERGWEGLVFHHLDGRMAKIKGRDFGWPARPPA